MTEHMSYADAGVDVREAARAVDAIREAVASTYRPEVVGDLGGFGGLFSAAALKGMQDPVLVSGTDGVGTKLAVAQRLDRLEGVGEDLVAMCVDDIVCCGAEPLFFLDYISVGVLRSEKMARIVKSIAAGCAKAGCALVGGEMAEHPGVMDPEDFDLAGFAVGVVDRGSMLGAHRVQEGDVILGLASSGFHSNGYSLVRRVAVEGKTTVELLRPMEALGGVSLADAVLAPTTIYAGGLVRALRAGAPIHALAHITGGGITENLNRSLPEHLDALVARGSWEIPPIIDYVADLAGLTPDEAYETFNMGVGMCVICAPEDAGAVSATLFAEGFCVFEMGRCVKGSGKVVYADEQ